MVSCTFSAVVIAGGLTFHVNAQTPGAEAIESIGARYRDTEERLGQMGHFTWRFDEPGDAVARSREAWVDANGIARKVSTEEVDSHGVNSRFFYLDENGLYFALKRSERKPKEPKGMTAVDEERLYFDGGRLIRHLAKSATFKPGEKIDTAKAKNASRPIATDGAGIGFGALSAEVAAVVAALRRTPGESPPAGKTENASEAGGTALVSPSPRFRLIEGTGSPDGRHALAWAPSREQPMDWSRFQQEDGTYLAEDPEAVVNYLVETPGGRLVSTLAGQHFGDKADYNHFEGSAHWSPNSKWVLHLLNRKWDTQSAHLYRLLEGDKVGGPLDLAATASGLGYAHLRKEGHPAVAKFGTGFAVTLYDAVWKEDGVLTLRVLGQIPKSEEEHSDFEITLELAFAVDGNGQIEARQKSCRTVE